jgi:hypothetical protein
MTTFNYGSGTLIAHPEVAAIFPDVPAAGLTWEDPYPTFAGTLLTDVCRITNFLNDLVDSAFMDLIGAEYSTKATAIGRGKFLGTFLENLNPAVAPVAPTFDVQDQDIRDMLASSIATSSLPPVNKNSCYFVFLPPSLTSVSPFGRSDSAQNAVLGYHSAFRLPSGQTVFYALIPYQGVDFAASTSHELAEMVTNPESNGWTAIISTPSVVKKVEIADVCDQTAFFHGEGITTFWSRSQGKCVAPAEDDLAKTSVRTAIRGGTCMGHAIESQPLSLTLDVQRAGVPQNVNRFLWTASDGQVVGTNTLSNFVVVPPPAPNTFTVWVLGAGPLGCAYSAQRDFQVVSTASAAREEDICTLLDRLRTVAIYVFRPNPLWDPLRDLVVRPASRQELEGAELFATRLMRLVEVLRTSVSADGA